MKLQILAVFLLSAFVGNAGVFAIASCGSQSYGGVGSYLAVCPSSIPDMPWAVAGVARAYSENPIPLLPGPDSLWEDRDVLLPSPYLAVAGASAYARGPGDNSAAAMLEQNYLLTITISDGGSGFYVPCLLTGPRSSATFAGVSLSGPNGFNCGAIDPDELRPFESGVPQIVTGSFRALAELRGAQARMGWRCSSASAFWTPAPNV